jgi:hypothetical protein
VSLLLEPGLHKARAPIPRWKSAGPHPPTA